MKRKTSVLSAVFILVMLTACAPQFRGQQQLVAAPDPVSLRLAAAADKASTALQTLASIDQVRNPGIGIESVRDNVPQELRRTISIRWSGPIDPIVVKLADRAGFKVIFNGNRPAVPIIVSIIAKEKSVIEVLRDVGLQAGKRANIIVDSENKVVELDYAPIFGNY